MIQDGLPFSDINQAINWGKKNLENLIDDESLRERESRWLLEAAAVSAGKDPLFILQSELTTRIAAVFRSYIARRARGEPFAYVIGEASFRGIDLMVTPDVLIPRPETEQLIDEALKLIPENSEWRIIDEGTGSGAIAVSIAMERKRVSVVGVDISSSAVLIAKKNVERHGLSERVKIIENDFLNIEDKFDIIIANLPYVPDNALLSDEVKEWEPRGALRGGAEGTEIIERSIEHSDKILKKDGILIYEIGEDQEEIFENKFPGRFEFKKDLANKVRFMIGRR